MFCVLCFVIADSENRIRVHPNACQFREKHASDMHCGARHAQRALLPTGQWLQMYLHM
jgi:hypothetical protein